MPGAPQGWDAELTLQSQVMHDLGQLAEAIEQHRTQRQRPPNRADADRFAAARAREQGMGIDVARRVAERAIQDWRATNRARTMRPEQDITDILGRVVVADQRIGVRVFLTLDFPNGRRPGQRKTVSMLINVLPTATKAQILQAAMQEWNSGNYKTLHGSDQYLAIDAEIAQVIVGGYPQADFSIAGRA
jgi:hypothetical protein